MNPKSANLVDLVDLIFNKFKKYKNKEIYLDKEELKNFVFSLLKEN